MHYPVVIHKDPSSDYGVIVPDLPGCVSAGVTVDEALANVREAIELHLEGLIEEGMAIPEPGLIEDYRRKRDYAGGTWAVVAVDPGNLRVKAKRLAVTMPERIVDAVDRYAKQQGETRSGLLTKAAIRYIDRAGDAPLRPARKGRPARRRRS